VLPFWSGVARSLFDLWQPFYLVPTVYWKQNAIEQHYFAFGKIERHPTFNDDALLTDAPYCGLRET